MAARREEEEGSDSEDTPEEFTFQQALQQDEEITKVQALNKARVLREGMERRRQWAQKIKPWPSRPDKSINDIDTFPESAGNGGMLPDGILKLLVAQEKFRGREDREIPFFKKEA